MLTNNLGYPRVGARRELKKACEQYWTGQITRQQLFLVAKNLRETHWRLQQQAGINLIPCNDFSFYDHVLDTSLLLGVIPERYTPVVTDVQDKAEIDLYFAMARGYQKDGLDITAMEMTKWFDTNYHYIVPEFTAKQEFKLFATKLFSETSAATAVLGKAPKPVLLGPVSYLLLGKEKEGGFDRIDLIKKLVPVYVEILNKLKDDYKVDWVQLDEPFLALDLTEKQRNAFTYAYEVIRDRCPHLKILLATYFESLADNTALATNLPVCALHLDLVRAPEQLDAVLAAAPERLTLSLGVVDGRNIWKNNYQRSLDLIEKAMKKLGADRVFIAPSSSLLHTPFDLDLETALPDEIKNWMAFAKQKLQEISDLKVIASNKPSSNDLLQRNQDAIQSRRTSSLIHKQSVKERVDAIRESDSKRKSPFHKRQEAQLKLYKLPLFPTTTIGSFPQTDEIRQLRAKLKKSELTEVQYNKAIETATIEVIRWQEDIGLDVLVHGEFERNDMVEYFGEQLEG